MNVNSSSERTTFSMLKFAIILIICLFLGYYNVLACIEKISSHSWPSVSGQIQHLETYTKPKSTDGCMQINYQYTIENIRYSSRRLAVRKNDTCYEKRYFDTLVAKFKNTGEVTIFYNPMSPSNSLVFKENLGLFDFLFFVFTLFGTFVAGLVIWRGTRNGRRVLQIE